MSILFFLLETEMRRAEEKGLNKIRCNHRWVKDRYLNYFFQSCRVSIANAYSKALIYAYESKD